MTKYEIKKVISRTGGRIALLLLLAVTGITCFFAAGVSYVDENGDTQSGPAAVAKLKAAQKEWAGWLDEENIQKVIVKNREIRSSTEALSQNVVDNEIAYSRGQGIKEIRNLLNCSYADEFQSYDYYRADTLVGEDASSFYENRMRLLKEWLDDEGDDQFSEKEKEYFIRQYENFDTPIYYDYMMGWQMLFDFAPTVVMFIMLILGYLVAGIFSNEFAWKSDAIYFSSFYGRNKAVLAKIKAGFLIVTGVYFAAFLLYTGAILLYFGADGWGLAIQASWSKWKCFYNFSNWQMYLLIAVGGYIGCLFISFMSMFISARTKSSVLAVMIPVVLIFIPTFIANLGSPVVSKILGLLPDQLLQVGSALNYFNLYSVGGVIIGEVPIIIALYTVLTVAMLPILYQTYRHLQVNG